ncbi:hypothetical protein D3C81_1697880 [compost metagenome]
MIAVQTGQGRVEQGEVQRLTGGDLTRQGLQGQLLVADRELDADAEGLGAIELAEILINLLALLVIVFRHQVDPILAGDDGGGDAAYHGGAGEGDDEPGPELAIPRLSHGATETNG